MSEPVDGAAPEVQHEFDRVWTRSDEHTKDIGDIQTELVRLARALDARQQRIDKLTVDLESPTRRVGDYLPDPSGMDKCFGAIPDMPLEPRAQDTLDHIRAILSRMLPPSGIPTPAQRMLLEIKAVVG
jgi:ParB-like chromosome segregation protein Spo0J